MRYIVSTCGTSLLTNAGRATEGLNALISRYANVQRPEDVPPEDRAKLQMLLDAIRDQVGITTEVTALRKLSAEINGITRLYTHGLPTGDDIHFLLSTDTWLGKETATAVARWLQRYGQTAEVVSIPDLRTEDLSTFQSGMAELINWCASNLSPLRGTAHPVIFQLAGGFKSVQGFMQTLAHFYADETVYIFESGEELLRIPRLPLRMDLEDLVEGNYSVLARLADKLPVAAAEVTALPETLVWIDDGKAAFTVWGDLVWDQLGKPLFRTRLRDTPSAKLRYGPGFAASVQGLPADRLELVNVRLGDLGRFLEYGQNPKRLDFKALSANPRPPFTHECDAWADRDAKRLFGHYKGDIFVLDALDNALH